MARTSDDPKHHTIILRIDEEMAKYIKKKSKQRNVSLSEWVRRLVKEEMTVKERIMNGNSLSKTKDYLSGVPDEIIVDLETMAMIGGGDFSALFEELQRAMDEEEINFIDKKLVPKIDISRFLKACENNGLDAQEVIDKIVEDMENGIH